MDAATLTAFRDRQRQGQAGDRIFVLNCQLGKNGPAARYAYEVARMEATYDRSPATHHTDTRIADRIVELINATDPDTSDTTQDRYQPNDEFAEITNIVASGDPVYAAWLYAAGTLFREDCGIYPDTTELADPAWRQRFDQECHPVVAARVMLHQRPMATIDLGHLVCPVCKIAGEIRAKEMWSADSHVGVDSSNVLYATGRGGSSTPDHTQFWCHECGTLVRLPGPIADWL